MEIQFYIHTPKNKKKLRKTSSLCYTNNGALLYTGLFFGFAAGLNIYTSVQSR
jgi:hypothetical protein